MAEAPALAPAQAAGLDDDDVDIPLSDSDYEEQQQRAQPADYDYSDFTELTPEDIAAQRSVIAEMANESSSAQLTRVSNRLLAEFTQSWADDAMPKIGHWVVIADYLGPKRAFRALSLALTALIGRLRRRRSRRPLFALASTIMCTFMDSRYMPPSPPPAIVKATLSACSLWQRREDGENPGEGEGAGGVDEDGDGEGEEMASGGDGESGDADGEGESGDADGEGESGDADGEGESGDGEGDRD